MNNFKCTNCSYKTFYSQYKCVIKSEKIENKDKKGNIIKCPQCNIPLIYINKKGSFTTNIGKFQMMSREEKANILKKRSRKDFEKNVEETRRHMFKNN